MREGEVHSPRAPLYAAPLVGAATSCRGSRCDMGEPPKEEQNKERDRLFGILKDLVVWENSNNKDVLDAARAEIEQSVGDDLPEFLDPFAGGGAIPLEAQRLGLKVHAHDLNPVAVMINKAMIEIPPAFADLPPVNPGPRTETLSDDMTDWSGSKGLACDVEYYGKWMRDEAFKRIGHLYPKVKVPKEQGGGEAAVIAWIWARTVKCPNPACSCDMPLVNSFDLSKKKGKEVWVEPIFEDGKLSFTVHSGENAKIDGTMIRRQGAVCASCGSPVKRPYIRDEGRAGRMGSALMAIVAEGHSGRLYISPDDEHLRAADVSLPDNYPNAQIPQNPRDCRTVFYGMPNYADLFTPRQLTAMTTFSSLVAEAQERATSDARAAGMADDDIPLRKGGRGARAYGEAVGVYLAFLVDKLADYNSSICSWHISRELIRNTFARQAIPMVWSYAEANPFSSSAGSYESMLEWVEECVAEFPNGIAQGTAIQHDAQSDCGLRNLMVSCDPPYYDNVGYADLSDYFYVWMRQSLKHTYPELFRTMLVPKAEELIAAPYRHENSKQKAKEYFEDGMFKTCRLLYDYARSDIPVTIYYAYKQQDEDNKGTASSGWETMLSSLINAGFTITGTWPMRTELANRSNSLGTNSLASSVILVCRKRPKDAGIASRRDFIEQLHNELKAELEELQKSNLAPVDMAQAAIGPGMKVYSKYDKILLADGTPIGIRTALQMINSELDAYQNEQSGELDSESRFCAELYDMVGLGEIPFGDADTLARARNVSVDTMRNKGILYAKGGVVRLLSRAELVEDKVEAKGDCVWLVAQRLAYELDKGKGTQACAELVAKVGPSDAEHAKKLAYRLNAAAERRGDAQEALAYNSVVAAWGTILSKSDAIKRNAGKQTDLGLEGAGDEGSN